MLQVSMYLSDFILPQYLKPVESLINNRSIAILMKCLFYVCLNMMGTLMEALHSIVNAMAGKSQMT